jgi:hypothetical protein
MATGYADTYARDAGFFRTLVTVAALVLVSGFVFNLAMGRSSFSAPLIVHLHAVTFMGWVFIVVAQFWLAAAGSIALHRMLGLLAVAWSGAMMVLGPLVTLNAVQMGRVPFFFQPQHFLLADPATLVAFAGLFAAAVYLRKRTDWHLRLQAAAFVPLLGPGVGRLIPMPFLTPYAFEAAGAVTLIVPLIGILRDRRVHGRTHPVWYWCIGAMVLALAVARVVAFTGVGDAIYAAAVAGTHFEGTDGRAFPPMPPGMQGPR